MSAGPTSPPPCAWQPTQLKALYRVWPCESWKALSPYSCVCCARKAASVVPATSGFSAVCEGGLVVSGGLLNSRCSRWQPLSASNASNAPAVKLLWKREHIQRASARALLLELTLHVAEALGRRWIARIEIARYQATRPAADAGEDGHVLTSIRSAE